MNGTPIVINVDITYFLGIIASIVGFAWFLAHKIGVVEECIEWIKKELGEIKKDLSAHRDDITQIKLDIVSISHSPVSLKQAYRHYIDKSGIKNLIKEHENEIVSWLESKKPASGLDAQNYLIDYVLREKIDKIIDLTEYKNYVYKKGGTLSTARMVLAVYLFEIIIPQVVKT